MALAAFGMTMRNAGARARPRGCREPVVNGQRQDYSSDPSITGAVLAARTIGARPGPEECPG